MGIKEPNDLTEEEWAALDAAEPPPGPKLCAADDWRAWSSPHWSLIELLAWIGTRSGEMVAGTANCAGSRLDRDRRSVERTRKLLESDLADFYDGASLVLLQMEAQAAFARQKLKSFGRKDAGEVEEMRATDWIDAQIWLHDGEAVSRVGVLEPQWTDVRVDWRDALHVWPQREDEGDVADLRQQEDAIGDRGVTSTVEPKKGRPQKYDWETFWIEVVRLAHHPDGLPAVQADLEEKMAAWCELNWGEEPSLSSIRPRLSKAYLLLGLR